MITLTDRYWPEELLEFRAVGERGASHTPLTTICKSLKESIGYISEMLECSQKSDPYVMRVLEPVTLPPTLIQLEC